MAGEAEERERVNRSSRARCCRRRYVGQNCGAGQTSGTVKVAVSYSDRTE